MKKSFFVWLLPFVLLASCKQSLSHTLEEDKTKMIEEKSFSRDQKNYFEDELTSLKKDNLYRYQYTINNPKKEYHHIKVILSPKKDTFFPFGYEDDYTLVLSKEEVDKKKNKVLGIHINFSSTIELDSLYAYFSSDEASFYYTILK